MFNPMKKILLIANNARSVLLFRRNFISNLIELNYDVVVCVPYDKSAFEELKTLGVDLEDIKLNRSSINPIKDFLSLIQIYSVLKKHAPYLCMFYTIKPVIYGSLACRMMGIKKVCSMVSGLGYVFADDGFGKKILRFFVKFAYRISLKNNYKIFFLNQDDLDCFITAGMLNKKQACRIDGEGVDLRLFSYVEPPKNEVSFLFVGRLLSDKGVREYVQAARIIKQRHGDVQFKLVGDVDDNPKSIDEGELQHWINEGFVEYCGYLDDVSNIMSQSSVFVLPSYREGLPMSVLEAMSIGRAIVTTDSTGCRDTVEDGVNGFLVGIKNVEDLVVAMEKFLGNTDLIISMGKESRRIAEEKFDVNLINKDIITQLNL